MVSPLLVALVCPLMMLVLMRGMHGGSPKHDSPAAPADSVELEQLRREVAALRDQSKHAR